MTIEEKVSAAAETSGVIVRDASKDIKDAKGAVLKTVKFQLPRFEGAEKDETRTDAELLESAIAFYQAVGEKNPVKALLADSGYGFSLGVRGKITQREALVIEGPEKRIAAMAKQLVAAKAAKGVTITLADAEARVRLMWEE